jgi:hypothetical protein
MNVVYLNSVHTKKCSLFVIKLGDKFAHFDHSVYSTWWRISCVPHGNEWFCLLHATSISWTRKSSHYFSTTSIIFSSPKSKSKNVGGNNHQTHDQCLKCTTTTWGYFAIQISSQTTKKDVSEISLLRTIIPCKFLSFCDTITFVPVQSQVLRNSRT